MVDTELLMGVYVCVRGYDEEYAGRKYWNCTGTEGLQHRAQRVNPTSASYGKNGQNVSTYYT